MTITCTQYQLNGEESFEANSSADLVMVFGSENHLKRVVAARSSMQNPIVIGCSTAGQISGAHVSDTAASVNLISFQHTKVQKPLSHI